MNKKLLAFLAPMILSIPLTVQAGKSHSHNKVHVNTASVQELDEQLIGVGRKTAEEIVKYREEHGPFKSWEDLDKVKYVGAATIEKNKKRVSFK